MKKALLLLAVMMLLTAMPIGCGDGMVDSAADRERRFAQINDYRQRQFVDDWDYLWLMERSEDLSQWGGRTGK